MNIELDTRHIYLLFLGAILLSVVLAGYSFWMRDPHQFDKDYCEQYASLQNWQRGFGGASSDSDYPVNEGIAEQVCSCSIISYSNDIRIISCVRQGLL